MNYQSLFSHSNSPLKSETKMDEGDFFRRDVCDLIDEAAAECTRTMSQGILQLAASPKAHSCVQGVVERRFYPLHIRDFYSVINILLLQLLLVRQRNPAANCEQKSSSGDSEARILLLEREVKESKKRYKELFKINQQWAKDYAELSKQLDTASTNNTASQDTSANSQLPSSTTCSQCIQYNLELESKTALLKDLGLNYNKMKLVQSGLETRLDESEKERKKMADEYKALSLQIQELGGAAMILRYREERTELIDEVRRLREKVSTVERERASLQTHLNRFKYSLRDLMADTDWRGNHSNGYATTSTQLYSNGSSHKVPQVFTDSNGYSTGTRNGLGWMGRRNERGCVNPRQFAPIRNVNPLSILPTADFSKDGTSPQTPPGYLSRGDLFDDVGESPEETEQNGKLSNCPNYLKIPLATQSESASNELPSPLTVPRPLSAPGSLFESTATPLPNTTTPTKQTYSPSDGEVTMINGLLHTQTHSSSSVRNHHHASNPSIIYTVPARNAPSPNTTSSTINQYMTGNYFKCPQCGIKFVQTEQNYDLWFDHVTKCNR